MFDKSWIKVAPAWKIKLVKLLGSKRIYSCPDGEIISYQYRGELYITDINLPNKGANP